MKIGILTHPLIANFGGIMQEYALKKKLEDIGHSVIIFEHINEGPKRFALKVRYLIYVKRFFIKLITGKNIKIMCDKYDVMIFNKKTKSVNSFIRKYIQDKYIGIDECTLSKIDAFIVGSDQVWRPLYVKSIEKYFLNFLDNNKRIRKIAYAASFGVKTWEFSKEQEKECSRLAKQFDLITVREDSGINLCKKYLGINAKFVLDPTMLLEKKDYIKIIENERISKSKGNLFVYILDESISKQNIVDKVTKTKGLIPFTIIPSEKQMLDGIEYPKVETWLRAFLDAEFVVTDSFHGCVFSIIFNKPFIAIGNEERGNARFDSLLKLFNIQDRLVNINGLSLDCINNKINWSEVNSIKKDMQEKSISLLINALK